MKTISLVKIADNLTDTQHKETAEKIFHRKLDGIEVSHLGGRWGYTWENDKNYNLDFLKFYKGIKALRLYLNGVTNLSPILVLAEDLENLQLGEFDSRKSSLEFIGQLTKLKYLSVVRNQNGLESITKLENLSELSLTGYSLDKLPFINNLRHLRRLYIGFGTSASLDNIQELSNLEELNILWVKQLADIRAISKLTNLLKIKIEDEKQILSLPDLSKLTKLQSIGLINLASLNDLSVMANSHVEELSIIGPNKNVDFLYPLSDAINPLKVYTFFYTKREQNKAEKILGNKFCEKEKMRFPISDTTSSIFYFDLETGLRII